MKTYYQDMFVRTYKSSSVYEIFKNKIYGGGGVEFQEEYTRFFKEFGESRKMVLSTSLHDIVSSRTMSIVALDERLYFQTDKTSRKYNQLKGNPNVSLCIDNIQIEGHCEEVGIPLENIEFSNAFKKHFLSSYIGYTSLKNERLFVVIPSYIQRWLYIDGTPYIEVFDVVNKRYSLNQYIGM